ncbi:MAG TPA: hypothetical protein PKA88_01615 [Polyangiaceae bacterium]|nr:hypothetical protein [Polyangiaceae bacterium]
MSSKFSDFLKENKLDLRRVYAASKKLEQLKIADRQLKLKKRKGGDEKEKAGEEGEKAAPAKPRSGRPVTAQLVAKVNAGKPVSGAAKTRLLRAVNHLLEQKKKSPVELKALF